MGRALTAASCFRPPFATPQLRSRFFLAAKPRLTLRWRVRAGDKEARDAANVEETPSNIVEGYNIDEETLLDSPLFANALKVVAAVAVCLTLFFFYQLAQPLVDNTIRVFPGSS